MVASRLCTTQSEMGGGTHPVERVHGSKHFMLHERTESEAAHLAGTEAKKSYRKSNLKQKDHSEN